MPRKQIRKAKEFKDMKKVIKRNQWQGIGYTTPTSTESKR